MRGDEQRQHGHVLCQVLTQLRVNPMVERRGEVAGRRRCAGIAVTIVVLREWLGVERDSRLMHTRSILAIQLDLTCCLSHRCAVRKMQTIMTLTSEAEEQVRERLWPKAVLESTLHDCEHHSIDSTAVRKVRRERMSGIVGQQVHELLIPPHHRLAAARSSSLLPIAAVALGDDKVIIFQRIVAPRTLCPPLKPCESSILALGARQILHQQMRQPHEPRPFVRQSWIWPSSEEEEERILRMEPEVSVAVASRPSHDARSLVAQTFSFLLSMLLLQLPPVLRTLTFSRQLLILFFLPLLIFLHFRP